MVSANSGALSLAEQVAEVSASADASTNLEARLARMENQLNLQTGQIRDLLAENAAKTRQLARQDKKLEKLEKLEVEVQQLREREAQNTERLDYQERQLTRMKRRIDDVERDLVRSKRTSNYLSNIVEKNRLDLAYFKGVPAMMFRRLNDINQGQQIAEYMANSMTNQNLAE